MGKEVLLPTPEARERHALRMLYERCNGANWGTSYLGEEINENWCDPDKPLSEWKGVTVEHDHVVKLYVAHCHHFKGACSQSAG